MKSKLFVLHIILFFITIEYVMATNQDSLLPIISETKKFYKKDTLDTFRQSFDLIAIAGAGITTGSTQLIWEKNFSIGTILALGLEIPFHDSPILAFQLYGQTWLSKSTQRTSVEILREGFRTLSNNLYYETALSGSLKLYIGRESWKLRFSFQLGYLLVFARQMNESTFEFCTDIYYIINDKIDISLSRRMNLGQLNMAGNGRDIFPNSLIVNVYFKLFW